MIKISEEIKKLNKVQKLDTISNNVEELEELMRGNVHKMMGNVGDL